MTPRVGAYYWDSRKRVSSSAGSLEDHEFGVDLFGGATLSCKLGERWKLGVSWEAWAADGRNDLRSLSAILRTVVRLVDDELLQGAL